MPSVVEAKKGWDHSSKFGCNGGWVKLGGAFLIEAGLGLSKYLLRHLN